MSFNYDFERFEPPVINEAELIKKQNQKSLRLQTAAIALAMNFSFAAGILAGVFLSFFNLFLGIALIVLTSLWAASAGLLSVVILKKKDEVKLWEV